MDLKWCELPQIATYKVQYNFFQNKPFQICYFFIDIFLLLKKPYDFLGGFSVLETLTPDWRLELSLICDVRGGLTRGYWLVRTNINPCF